MTTDRPRYDAKLGLILRTAASVFAERGYHQASIRDISRATGVSLSGLYYYVESKEQLLYLIQEHCFGTVLSRLERLLEGVADPGARLRLLIENHLHFFVSNMDEMKVLSHEAESLTGEKLERVNRLKKRYVELCRGILSDLRPKPGVDERVATFALFGMMNWVYTWYDPARNVPVDRLVDDVHRLFVRGYLGSDGAAPARRTAEPAARAAPSIWRR